MKIGKNRIFFVYFQKKIIFQVKNACFLIETTNVQFLKQKLAFYDILNSGKIGIFDHKNPINW